MKKHHGNLSKLSLFSIIQGKKDKKAIKVFVVLIVVFSAFYLLYNSFCWVHYGVFLVENYVDTDIVHYPRQYTRQISASKNRYDCVYECCITRENALIYASEMKWQTQEISCDKPIKIRRYNWFLDMERFLREEQELTQNDEVNDSCFHYVTQGFYYDNTNGDVVCESQRILVAYDDQQKKLYVYYRSR